MGLGSGVLGIPLAVSSSIMRSWILDLRFTVRSLARQPGFTFVALLTLALGVGATSTVWSFAQAMLLEPLPYPDPEELVLVWQDHREQGGPEREWFSYPTYLDYRNESDTLAGLSFYTGWQPTLAADGAERVQGGLVSHDFFSTLAVPPATGRTFSPEDDRPGASPVVVVSRELADRRGLSAGNRILVDSTQTEVVGILPAGFSFPLLPQAEIWSPMRLDPARASRGAIFLRTVGRLRDGVSLDRARSDLEALAARLAQAYPQELSGVRAQVFRFHDELVRGVRPALLLLLAAVGTLLLVAVINVAHLLLARGVARGRELAVRTSLGADRTRLVRQLLIESSVLALAGGALGVLLAGFGVDLLLALAPADANLPRLAEVQLDLRVVVFTFGVSLAVGLLFGLAPAWMLTRRHRLDGTLRDGDRAGWSPSQHRLSRGLMAVETALALVLLIASGLLLTSFSRLTSVDPGFRPEGLVSFSVITPASEFPERQQIPALYDRLLERLEGLPGVERVAAVSSLPLTLVNTDTDFLIEGRPEPPDNQRQAVWYRQTTPDYFRTVGLPILAGRALSREDHAEGRRVVVVNESLADRYFPAGRPLGERLIVGGEPWEIVGVAHDVRHFGLDRDEPPALYLPLTQLPARFMDVVLRTDEDSAALIPEVRRIVQEIDPRLPAPNVGRLTDRLADSVSQERTTTWLVVLFGLTALILAAVGLYGVVSYAARRRLREIGVRMALGARAGDVVRLVTAQGLSPVLLGIGAGLAGSWAVGRALSGWLFGIDGVSWPVWVGSVVVLVAAATLATLVPAHRATRVDPVRVLREEG